MRYEIFPGLDFLLLPSSDLSLQLLAATTKPWHPHLTNVFNPFSGRLWLFLPFNFNNTT